MEIEKSLECLLTLIRTHKVLIYGTGYVGKRFFAALQLHNLNENVLGFVSENTDPIVCGLSNKCISSIEDRNVLICIAVHESILPEIVGKT